MIDGCEFLCYFVKGDKYAKKNEDCKIMDVNLIQKPFNNEKYNLNFGYEDIIFEKISNPLEFIINIKGLE